MYRFLWQNSSKGPCVASSERVGWRNPTGEKIHEALKLQFDRRLRLEFHSAEITSGAGLLAYREDDCDGKGHYLCS
jgi:hypothetical protein